MTNISSTAGSGKGIGSLIDKKTGLAIQGAGGGDLPTTPFEDDEQRLIHQHKRNARDPFRTARTVGGRKAGRRLIRL